jgi:digalactosyldiacylglycerol synthase
MCNLSWEAATEKFVDYSDLDKVLNDDAIHPGQDGTINKTNLTT